MKNISKTLLFGIGNCGREDDGLGWAFIDRIKPKLPNNCDYEYRYQLQIEDAELIGEFDNVVFIDASRKELENGYSWDTCQGSNTHSFSTHALLPETILYLSEHLYQHSPRAFVLGIQGHKWELKNGLTKKAKENLQKAYTYFTEQLSDYKLGRSQLNMLKINSTKKIV